MATFSPPAVLATGSITKEVGKMLDLDKIRNLINEQKGVVSSMAWYAYEQKRSLPYFAEQLVSELERLQQENAAYTELLTDVGNELLMAGDDGAWYAEHGDSPFMHKLADKLNKMLL